MMDNTARIRRCTIQLYNGSFCDGPGMPEAPFPICAHHARKAYEFGESLVDNTTRPVRGEVAQLLSDHSMRGVMLKPQPRLGEKRPCVYFLVVGEHLKIGATETVRQRIASYPPSRRVLHIQFHADAWALEKQYHRKFQQHLIAGNEWFAVCSEILEFIDQLKAAECT
jgi:T5orf172 domain